MSFDTEFTKENFDSYLKELGKEYQKLGGKGVHCEIVLVGGASILANYGFRAMTNDMDAITAAPSILKDAINIVGDRFGLKNGWLNDDFKRTTSYSSALREVSKYYKTFSRVLEVRTVDAEYLVAMKLKSGRQYKNDLSDIVGIIAAHRVEGNPLTMEKIDKAVCRLYGSWADIQPWLTKSLAYALEHDNDPSLYENYRQREAHAKDALLSFEKQYPNTLTEANIDAVLAKLQKKELER